MAPLGWSRWRPVVAACLLALITSRCVESARDSRAFDRREGDAEVASDSGGESAQGSAKLASLENTQSGHEVGAALQASAAAGSEAAQEIKTEESHAQTQGVWRQRLRSALTSVGLSPDKVGLTPDKEQKVIIVVEKSSEEGLFFWVVFQLVIAIFYWMLITSKYPVMPEHFEANEEAKKFMELGPCSVCCSSSCATILHTICCAPARMATTLHVVGELNYWLALFLMTFCPFCTICAVQGCTEVPKKLGGETRNCCMALLCTCFCTACVICQDAEALDRVTGAKMGCCGVTTADNV
eukprot:TRINITY_DN58824_c0_g1_i1.p1 TRINITY_DN58824_c0_g1~~TRINITY_DN58824_c0_g1_i1.p1  ORF type:complete len:297 (-),score=51.81 TRINITY_DN58824_c0_g1_i1:164-1054(-)